MSRWRTLRERIPTIRFEGAGGQTVSAGSVLAKPWRDLAAIPGFTFYLIRTVTVLLAFIGLIMGFSASTIRELSAGSNPYISVLRPLAIVVIGFVIMALVSRVPYRITVGLAPIWLILGTIFQLLVFTPLGMGKAGNRNWVWIGFTTIQPSELLKVAFVLWLAWVFGAGFVQLNSLRSVAIWVLVPATLAIGVVMAGHDLGTAFIFGSICMVTLFVAGWRTRWLALLTGAVLALAAAAVAANPARVRRVKSLFSSTPDPLGTDLQTLRAQWGLGTGGLAGVGPGASRQKWNYLPEAHTDFIFAILGEEFGLIGTVSVLILFVLLAVGFYRLLTQARDRTVATIATASAGWIIVQALINILVVIGWAPVVGVPLPFLSSGGSSLLASFVIMGVVLACAREEPGAHNLVKSRLRWPGPLAVTSRSGERRPNHG